MKPIDTPATRAILKICARHCGVSVHSMVSGDRHTGNPRARLLAIYLLRWKLKLDAQHIGPIVGFTLDGVYDARSPARRPQPEPAEIELLWAMAQALILRETHDENENHRRANRDRYLAAERGIGRS
jgi:hypothetical protein